MSDEHIVDRETVVRLYSDRSARFQDHRHTYYNYRPATWYFFHPINSGAPDPSRAFGVLWYDGQTRDNGNSYIELRDGFTAEGYDNLLNYNRLRSGATSNNPFNRNNLVYEDTDGNFIDPNTGLPAASPENTLSSRFQERLVEFSGDLNGTSIFSYFDFNNLDIVDSVVSGVNIISINIEIPFIGFVPFFKDAVLNNIKDYSVEFDRDSSDVFELIKIIVASPIGNNKKYIINEFNLANCFSEEDRVFNLVSLPVDFTGDSTFEVSLYAQDIRTTEIYDKTLLTISLPNPIITEENTNNLNIPNDAAATNLLRSQIDVDMSSSEDSGQLSDDTVQSIIQFSQGTSLASRGGPFGGFGAGSGGTGGY